MAAVLLHSTVPSTPADCRDVGYDFLPVFIVERCHVCGVAVVLRVRRDRMHFFSFVCTEALVVCDECYELEFCD